MPVESTHSWHPHSKNYPSLPMKLLFYPSIPSPPSSFSSAPSEEPAPASSSNSRPNFTLAPPISAAFSPFTALGVVGPHWFEENWPWSIIGAGDRREMRELELVRLGDCVELVQLAPDEFDLDPIRLPSQNRVRINQLQTEMTRALGLRLLMALAHGGNGTEPMVDEDGGERWCGQELKGILWWWTGVVGVNLAHGRCEETTNVGFGCEAPVRDGMRAARCRSAAVLSFLKKN